MMPATGPTALDDIGRICNRRALVGRVFSIALLLGALSKLSKLFKFVWLGDTTSMAWETRTKYIRHQRNIVLYANRALHTCCITKVFCSAHQVGVSVTQLFSAQAAAAKLIDQSTTRQTVINNATNSFTVVVGESELAEPTRWAS